MLGQAKFAKNSENVRLNNSQIFLSLTSGVLLAIAGSIPSISWLSWFALIPFFLSLYTAKISAKSGFKLSFIFSLTYYLGLLTWLFRLYPLTWIGFTEFQSIIMITAAWFVFSLIESIGLSFVGGIIGLLKPKSYHRILLPIAVWLIIEWIQSIGATGFTWGRLAISQYLNLPIIQSANLFGSLIISALIILTNVVIALSIIDYQKSRLSYKPLITTILVLLANLGYGYYSMSSRVDDGKEVNAVVVQGNILSDQKWDMKATDIFNLYKGLTEEAIKKHPNTNIVVWPESAITDAIDVEKDRTVKYPEILPNLRELAKNTNAYITTGIFTIKFLEQGKYDIANSIVSVAPDGQLLGPYVKRHLVPFGEYIPFFKVIEAVAPSIAKMNPLGHEVAQGKDTSLISTTFGKIGGIVCYDSIIPQLIRSSVNDGAELLVLVTNDSWYKDSVGVYQHNAQSVFRSIESDRYMLRAANTGMSTIIRPDGEIISRLEPLVKGYIANKVKSRDTKTLYSKIGDSIAILSLIIVLFIIVTRKKDDLMLIENE